MINNKNSYITSKSRNGYKGNDGQQMPHPLSLIETYIKNHSIPMSYHRLNSICAASGNVVQDDMHNKQTIEFEVKIDGTTIVFKKRLQVIDDIRKLNLVKWFDELEKLIECNNWSDTQVRLILSNVIQDDFVKVNEIPHEYSKMRNYLLRIRYPIQNRILLLKRLESTKQCAFTFIDDYYMELSRLLQEYGVTVEMSKKDYDRRFYEYFIGGLGRHTRIEVARYETEELAVIIKMLKKIENSILTVHEEGNIGKPTMDIATEPVYVKNENNSKWCSLHKSRTHSTNECFMKNRMQKQAKPDRRSMSDNRDEKDLVFKEDFSPIKSLDIKGRISGRAVDVTVDTGASKNYINKNILEYLGLFEREDRKLKTIFGNGADETSDTCVETYITFNNIKTEYSIKFYVLKMMPTNVLIGNDFLSRNDALIDFKRNCITIDDNIISFSSKPSMTDSLDTELVNSLAILHKRENIAVDEVVKNYKTKNKDFGCMKVDPVKLKFLSNIPISKHRKYVVPHKYVDGAKKEIKRLIDLNIIEPSETPYSSPAFIIEKKNKSLRLVVDYREINKYIIDEVQNIPNIFESLQKIGKNEYFSLLDLSNGFNQVPLDLESRIYTGFNILNVNYVYKRIPFGLKCGPKVFQHIISNLLKEISNCFVYIDDILIYGKDRKEHDECLKEVFKILFNNEIQLNFEKSSICKNEIEILGHRINSAGIHHIDKYLDNPIFNQEINTKKRLQKLLGTINWYRRFMPDMSSELFVFTNLLKSNERFKWTNELQNKLKIVINKIKTNSELKHPNYKKRFYIECVASNVAIGGVLYQSHGVLGYYSYKLEKSELNYTIVEKELYGIIKTIMFFKNIIQGHYTVVKTDSQNCLYQNNKISTRIERWKLY